MMRQCCSNVVSDLDQTQHCGNVVTTLGVSWVVRTYLAVKHAYGRVHTQIGAYLSSPAQWCMSVPSFPSWKRVGIVLNVDYF